MLDFIKNTLDQYRATQQSAKARRDKERMAFFTDKLLPQMKRHNISSEIIENVLDSVSKNARVFTGEVMLMIVFADKPPVTLEGATL